MAAEDLARLRELSAARASVSLQLMDLELDKVTILMAGKRIKEAQDDLFRRLAEERGITDPNSMDINSRTGEVATSALETPASENPAVDKSVSENSEAPAPTPRDPVSSTEGGVS